MSRRAPGLYTLADGTRFVVSEDGAAYRRIVTLVDDQGRRHTNFEPWNDVPLQAAGERYTPFPVISTKPLTERQLAWGREVAARLTKPVFE